MRARTYASVILAGNLDSRRHSTTSFSENSRSGGNKVSNARSFMILRSGEGRTSFINYHRVNFSGEKKFYETFWGVENMPKTFNLVLV